MLYVKYEKKRKKKLCLMYPSLVRVCTATHFKVSLLDLDLVLDKGMRNYDRMVRKLSSAVSAASQFAERKL